MSPFACALGYKSFELQSTQMHSSTRVVCEYAGHARDIDTDVLFGLWSVSCLQTCASTDLLHLAACSDSSEVSSKHGK